MDEPITWAGWITMEFLYVLGAVLSAIITTIGVMLADKYEDWQKSKPHWENDWD